MPYLIAAAILSCTSLELMWKPKKTMSIKFVLEAKLMFWVICYMKFTVGCGVCGVVPDRSCM